LDEEQAELEELRLVVRAIERSGKSRAAIAAEAEVDPTKISKFLGSRNRLDRGAPQGINAETALRLWAYTRWWTAATPDARSESAKERSREAFEEDFGPSGNWTAKAAEENKLKIQGDLRLIINWVGSAGSVTRCLAIPSAAGGRLILPRGGTFGRKIDSFSTSLLRTRDCRRVAGQHRKDPPQAISR
jgi:hypothetical protein